MNNVISDSFRQTGEAAEHTGKEYPGWVQALHLNEPCESLPLSFLFCVICQSCAYHEAHR